jgi:hypothetical protein
VVTRHVKVAAAISFDTGSAWGDIGSYPSRTHFGRGSLRTQYGGAPCPQPAPYPTCVSTLTWGAAAPSAVTLAGGWTRRHGKKHGTLTAQRLTFLTTPAEANRIDLVTTSAPAPALTDSHGNATLAVTTFGGRAVGSATLASTTAEHPYRVTCDTKHHHDLQTTWSDASYTNGSTPLVVHEQIEGKLTVPDSASDGSVERNTRQD